MSESESQDSTELAAPVVEDRPDLATLQKATAQVAVTWACPHCGKQANVVNKKLLAMVLAADAALKCPFAECGKWTRLQIERDTQMIKPASVQVMNREAKRTIASLQRRGLIHPR